MALRKGDASFSQASPQLRLLLELQLLLLALLPLTCQPCRALPGSRTPLNVC